MFWLAFGVWFSVIASLIAVVAHEIGRTKAAARCMELVNLHGRNAASVIEEEFKLRGLNEEESPWQP